MLTSKVRQSARPPKWKKEEEKLETNIAIKILSVQSLFHSCVSSESEHRHNSDGPLTSIRSRNTYKSQWGPLFLIFVWLSPCTLCGFDPDLKTFFPSFLLSIQWRYPPTPGSGLSSAVRAPDSWSIGGGFESQQERRLNVLLKGKLPVLTLTLVSVPPPFYRSTPVARKRSLSFCQRCRWQVTAKHAYILRM